ncbi:3893_t:CDS:2 [Paraglomus occultum]|uniref:3893_t:CDS:1 n=1 Tax=Paraglomus occultum TaxID=144539 RepID=A0A9N9BFT9_9GLOM|nr:3893_t:CDS:2 [Paraglomus occultum]
MKELRTIILNNTDVDSGLDYLSDNCRELYCEPDTTKKSAKIAKKSQKWEEFTKDAVELLDNYHELKGILESLRGYKIGKEKLDEALKDLDNRSKEFSTKYDEDSNGTISIFELQTNKNELAQDLDKEKIEEGSSQLGGIFQAIKELEKEINKYRRSFYYGTVEEEEKNEIRQEATRVEIPSELIQDDSHIRLLDSLEDENIELETRIEALPKK